jgi:hypothetical protein
MEKEVEPRDVVQLQGMFLVRRADGDWMAGGWRHGRRRELWAQYLIGVALFAFGILGVTNPTCVTDKGSEYAFTLPRNGANLHNDHLSVVGLAATAAFYWPLVKIALGKS